MTKGITFQNPHFDGDYLPGETGRWLVAYNPETGTTIQGKTVEQALKNLKEATALYLEEVDLLDRSCIFVNS